MFATDDTIVAVATPPGRGGIGVVRLSGPRAAEVACLLVRANHLEPRHVTLTEVRDRCGRTVDRVLATYFPRPASYTGEDVVEISGHGSPILLQQVVAAAQRVGARLAEPGEFTLRAFLNGRLDLVQAEAVGDLINAVTPLQARIAFDQLEGTATTQIGKLDAALFDLVTRLEASIDFPDEGYHFVEAGWVATETRALAERVDQALATARQGRLVREGCSVVIVGKPNVGKSSLFNRLLGAPRAIVAEVAGTTRDLLTETTDFEGIPVTLVDTAGIHETENPVESEGVTRARGAKDVAGLVVVVLDRSRPLDDEDKALLRDTRRDSRVIVVNKTDLPDRWTCGHLADLDVTDGARMVPVSLVEDVGLGELRTALGETLWAGEQLRDTPALSNLRHIELLQRTAAALKRATAAAAAATPEELILADLQEAREALEEITGKRTPDDVLQRIFERFCVGK